MNNANSGSPALFRQKRITLACLGLACLLALAFPARADDNDWKLVEAARTGNERLMTQLLDAGADPRGQAAVQAVVEAAKNGKGKALEVLLSRGAPADAETSDYLNPRKAITLAAASGNEESVALLLRHGARADARNEFPWRFTIHGASPSRYRDNHKSTLMYAAEGGHAGIVRLLLKAGARPNAETVYDETALMFAAGKGHIEAVKALIEGGADLNAAAEDRKAGELLYVPYGGTALAYAVRYAWNSRGTERKKGRVVECKEYLDAAYEIVAAYKRKKERVDDASEVLGLVLSCREIPLLSSLVELRAVERARDVLLYPRGKDGEDIPEVVKLLIQAGADVNARYEKPRDMTPLMLAASAGWSGTVTMLLDAGARINATTSYGHSALWFAAQQKRTDVVSSLLGRGADPNIVAKPDSGWDSKGGSALNAAVEGDCIDCARELLLRGANPNIPDSSGKTPAEALRKAGLLPESAGERALK